MRVCVCVCVCVRVYVCVCVCVCLCVCGGGGGVFLGHIFIFHLPLGAGQTKANVKGSEFL